MMSGGGTASGAAAGTPAASGGNSAGQAGAALAGSGGSSIGGSAGTGGGANVPGAATVVLFLIDGLQSDAVATGAANGADNIKSLIDGGVTVQTVYSTSPAPRLELPDGTLPWGNATSGNVAVHTGCHLHESNQMDDIFLAAQSAGIKSVFAGGDANYSVFTTPDFEYSGNLSDAVVVQHGIDHLRNDGARLLRLHLQRIRDHWNGPASKSNANSPYIRHLLAVDELLGQLIQALKDSGVWETTFLVMTSDHGMGETSASDHPPSARSSWENFMVLHGPGLKRGATIPYAELPDVAIFTAHVLGLAPLKGHLDPAVTLRVKGTTGTLLENVFETGPAELEHPQLIERYLDEGTYPSSGNDYADYRSGMLGLLQ